MIDPNGCIYDEENCGYEFNEGNDYPVNPFDVFSDEED